MTLPRDSLGRVKRPLNYSKRQYTLLDEKTNDKLLKIAQMTGQTLSTIMRLALEREVAEWEQSGGERRL